MTASRLQDLVDLAREPSSEKRRELLRELTDHFFGGGAANAAENELYGAVLAQLTAEMEQTVREELSVRFSASAATPRSLARTLAMDVEEVAGPILRACGSLQESDLLDVVRTQGQGHLRAVSERDTVSEAVSDVIVERGDDDTVGVLVRNDGARLSRAAHEAVVDRAEANPDLQDALVNRAALPADLLNELYFVAEARLRQKILEKNANLSPERLEAALASGRNRLRTADGSLPADFDTAQAYVRELRAAGALSPEMLARFLRSGGRTEFLIALSELSDIEFDMARRIIDRCELDALAVVCKAADMERALFLTYAVVLLNKDGDAMGKAQSYGRMYGDLTREAAQRTLRFWRMRRDAAVAA